MTKVSLELNKERRQYGQGAGIPVLKTLWERFNFSQIFSDIDKHCGSSPWKLTFSYVCGLLANSQSVNKIAENDKDSPILSYILDGDSPSQSAFSRFFAHDHQWIKKGVKRILAFCNTSETAINTGDIVALDDTKIEHPYGKLMPFLCWLFDNSDKRHLWCMNLVSTLLVRSNGLVTPLLWRIWVQDKSAPKADKKTKLDLAKEMLQQIRNLTDKKLWVAMDRWFLCKEFFQWLTSKNFDWVTKAKRNTALYIESGLDWKGNPRFVPINPAKLISQVYPQLLRTGLPDTCVSISVPGVYMKLPAKGKTKKGKDKTIQVMTPIAAIATIRLPEDIESAMVTLDTAEPDERAANYKGAYLLLSNRYDAPEEAVNAYAKRWKIEVFYRNAKQELGLTACHARSRAAHEGHIEMIFVAETLLNYANWQLNSENADGAEDLVTHGQMVRGIFNASHRIKIQKIIRIYCDIKCDMFSRFMQKYWPEDCRLGLGRLLTNWNDVEATA